MMEEDYDEDVIFENSPLYQHLKEAGVTDIDVEPVKPSGTDSPIEQDKEKREIILTSVISQICKKCLKYFSSIFQGKDKHHDKVRQWYQYQALSTLCSSSVLVEDDRLFLQDFARKDEDLERIGHAPQHIDRIRLIFPSLLLPCLLASLAVRLTDASSSYSLTFDLGLCLSGVMGVACMAVIARDYQRRRHYGRLCSTLTDFLETAYSLLTQLRKSLRLIQETELVARGFTLVSQKTAIAQLDQKPSVSTMRQCPELRRCLFTTARSTTLKLREATLSLISIHPLIPEIDSISHFLCGISLEEYGPCLHTQNEGDEGERELYHLTDGYSVAALKAMTELSSLHLSEFVRRLALCFSSPSQLSDQDTSDPFHTFSITNQLHETLTSRELSLRRVYDFHKCSPQGRPPKPHPPHTKSTSQTEEFYIAIHSLDLHLQSAITRVQDLASRLESKLEGELSANEKGDFDEPANEKLEYFMSGVKAELEACKGCWEEGMTRLEKSKKQVPKLDNIPDLISQKPQARVIPFAEIGDPIIEDQVFEAYTDPDEVDFGTLGWEPILSPEEQEKKKREKQEALRLLTELKSVISIRAQDREKREQVALSRMGKGKITPVQPDKNLPEDYLEEKYALTNKDEINGSRNTSADEMNQFKKCSEVPVCGKVLRLGEVSDEDGDDNLEEGKSEGGLSDPTPGRGQGEDVLKQEYHLETGHSPHTETQDKLLLTSKQTDYAPNRQSLGIVRWEQSSSDEHIDSKVNQKPYGDSESDVESNERNKVMSDPTSVLSAAEGPDLVDKAELKERLERIHGASLGFTANIAAMAAARSASLRLTEQTFGDTFGDSSSGDEEDGGES